MYIRTQRCFYPSFLTRVREETDGRAQQRWTRMSRTSSFYYIYFWQSVCTIDSRLLPSQSDQYVFVCLFVLVFVCFFPFALISLSLPFSHSLLAIISFSLEVSYEWENKATKTRIKKREIRKKNIHRNITAKEPCEYVLLSALIMTYSTTLQRDIFLDIK